MFPRVCVLQVKCITKLIIIIKRSFEKVYKMFAGKIVVNSGLLCFSPSATKGRCTACVRCLFLSPPVGGYIRIHIHVYLKEAELENTIHTFLLYLHLKLKRE